MLLWMGWLVGFDALVQTRENETHRTSWNQRKKRRRTRLPDVSLREARGPQGRKRCGAVARPKPVDQKNKINETPADTSKTFQQPVLFDPFSTPTHVKPLQSRSHAVGAAGERERGWCRCQSQGFVWKPPRSMACSSRPRCSVLLKDSRREKFKNDGMISRDSQALGAGLVVFSTFSPLRYTAVLCGSSG